jgi:hypothetical protein
MAAATPLTNEIGVTSCKVEPSWTMGATCGGHLYGAQFNGAGEQINYVP